MQGRARALVAGAAVGLLALSALGPAAAGEATDRLERFRQLATSRLGAAQVLGGETSLDDLWSLLDEEIVESLASGGVFASLAFLQDRLDGLAEVWGGASLRLTRVGALTVGAFHLSDSVGGNSVRVYGEPDGGAQLLAAVQREGRPIVEPLPPGPDGAAQLLVAWEGPFTGRGGRLLRLDLMRRRGANVTTVWSTAEVFPDGLTVRDWRVRGREIRVRYELRYAGWVPGCERQTEQEDIYRLSPDGGTFTRASRRQHNAWHQAFRRTVAGLFDALDAHDPGALAALVPDERVRRRLPTSLRPEPACDAPDGPEPTTVSVAASGEGGAPWALTWEHVSGRWRLRGAAPVLQ
jgi:hypothetical protein